MGCALAGKTYFLHTPAVVAPFRGYVKDGASIAEARNEASASVTLVQAALSKTQKEIHSMQGESAYGYHRWCGNYSSRSVTLTHARCGWRDRIAGVITSYDHISHSVPASLRDQRALRDSTTSAPVNMGSDAEIFSVVYTQ